MTRNYSIPTIKRLFTLSGNVCAFPDCNTNMIDPKRLIIIGQICHIEGENETSPRFNSNMTEELRRDFDNLILLCPTHHIIIDRTPAQYTTNILKQMKANHQEKYKNMLYVPPDEIVRILNISVNTDEYSVERIHNLLKLYRELTGDETKKTWRDYFKHAFKGLKLSSPVSQDEVEALSLVFDDIVNLKHDDEDMFQDLLLIFLERIPSELRDGYITRIKTYIEGIIQKDFENANLPRMYIYLNRSETDTLDYLINNADNFNTQNFNNFLTYVDSDLFKKLAETKKLFLDYERKIWTRLGEAERAKEEHPNLYENIKTLVNKFININL
jgi:hypothetical protein